MRKLKKKCGNARIKKSAVVRFLNAEEARIIFVPTEKMRRWLAVLSADKELAEEEIVRLYGKRWDIEDFFKMCKQHLKLADEFQIRDFNGLIAHTSMIFARYNILSWFQRQRTDGRTFGGIFRICCKEMENIKFIDALSRIMQMPMAVMPGARKIPEKALESIMFTVMGSSSDLNRFLRSGRILTVYRDFVSHGENSFWGVAVEYLSNGSQTAGLSAVASRKTRVDYKAASRFRGSGCQGKESCC